MRGIGFRPEVNGKPLEEALNGENEALGGGIGVLACQEAGQPEPIPAHLMHRP